MSSTTPPATTLATATSTSTTFLTTPLLTIFTPPASCNPKSISTWSSCASASGTWTCAPQLDDNCLPLPSSKLSTAIFSPGVCPMSYYAAVFSGLPDAATTAWCCPSGAIYNSGSCASRITGAYATTAVSGATTTATNLVVTTAEAGVAVFIGVFPTIQVAWATSDLPLFTPASAPILANAGAQSTSSASSSATASTTSRPQNLGLSTAAQAGIGVGAAIFALALLVIGCLLLWRRRRTHNSTTSPHHGTPAEMPGHEMDLKLPHYPYAELGQEGVVSELAVHHKSPTVHGRQSVWHEMEGDFTPVEVRGDAPPIGVRFPARLDEKEEGKT